MSILTEFTQQLINGLKEKKKNGRPLADSSIAVYMRNLEKLNDNIPIRNLKFLENIEDVKEKLANYKPTTYRNFLISIVSALSIVKNESKKNKKLYDDYYKMMMDINNQLKNEPMGQMSETQRENWVSMDDIKNVLSDVENKVNKFKDNKEIGLSQYNVLLDYLILSLYILIQPRRNADYQKMNITKNPIPIDSNVNFYNVDDGSFIFNCFKTSKSIGQQEKIIPQDLKNVIDIYLRHHPLYKKIKQNKIINVPFLVYYDGEPFKQTNSITRILNRLFAPKKVGSSLLRHIYLSDKYGDLMKEQLEDAEAMAHSVSTARDNYIKFD